MTELQFKGKEFVFNHHLTVPFRPLVPHADKSIGSGGLDQNLIVHGDNLHGLKALLPFYAGKVDCIFIDPPYNTGNEGWSYNDNVNSPMIKEWLAANPVGIEDGLRHDKWCAMMWPRLRLLHELLADDGTLWITLDHNESHRAKLMLDEIFGEPGGRGFIAWRSSDNSNNDAKGFSTDYNSIFVYSKQATWKPSLLDSPEKRKHFKNPDNDPDGPYFDGNPVDSPSYRENLRFDLETPSGKLIPPPKNGWRWEKPKLLSKIASGEIRYSADESRIIRRTYLNKMKGLPPSTLWIDLEKFGHNRRATLELQSIFGGASPFETPKPLELVSAILDLVGKPDAIVLDSFAGSGTTAHAVLEANRRDEGTRSFILIQMPEQTQPDSIARKMGFDEIIDITAERVRRAINGYDFDGVARTELLRTKLTWRSLERADRILEQVQSVENLHSHEFIRIKKEVKDGELIVTGEKAISERVEGLGGSFTFCTLGNAVEMDTLLSGGSLPDPESLAAVLWHIATASPFGRAGCSQDTSIGDGVARLGAHAGRTLWLIYKPDLAWLKSADAALSLAKARAIAATSTGDHLIFAPAKFVSRELLARENLKVEYAPLPFALYKIETA